MSRNPGRYAFLRSVAADSSGATTLEFALCGVAFLTLLIGILQIAIVFFVQQNVQTVAETVARRVMTGQVAAGTTREQFRLQVCGQLPAFLKCSNLYADVRQVTDMATAGDVTGGVTVDAKGAVKDSTKFDPGGSGNIVVLRLIYVWPVGTTPLGLDLGNQRNGSRTILGTMVFKSEPYA